MRQYKVERECNAIIQQSREEKIARMESLVDGVLPKEDYYTDELAALQLEYKVQDVNTSLNSFSTACCHHLLWHQEVH